MSSVYRKIPRDLTEASLSGAGLSIVAALTMVFLFGMVSSFYNFCFNICMICLGLIYTLCLNLVLRSIILIYIMQTCCRNLVNIYLSAPLHLWSLTRVLMVTFYVLISISGRRFWSLFEYDFSLTVCLGERVFEKNERMDNMLSI